MLRSIFSLIHKILDSSEKKYNNTKSKAVIYCFTNPDDTVNMNLEIAGKPTKIVKSVKQESRPVESKKENSFSIETEHGDVVTCRHRNKTNIVPKSGKDDLTKRITFANVEEASNQDDKKSDIDLEVQPNVRDLIENVPKTRLEITPKGKDQISLLLEQIQKMKTGLERLQEIAVHFNCSERFTEDVNYLINNVRPHLGKQSKKNSKKNDVSPKE